MPPAGRFNTERPPLTPAGRRGGGVNARSAAETSKFLLDPDSWSQPYLSVPGGPSFVWHLGVQGFEIQDQAELGKHKYIGSIELDVDVIHKAETTITLSGVFPGWTSIANMRALREVFHLDTPAPGKILHLPGILPTIQYVVCESLQNSHAQDERTRDISYSLSMVRAGTGERDATRSTASSDPGSTPPGSTAPPTGSGQQYTMFVTTASLNTLRRVAQHVYGDGSQWQRIKNWPVPTDIVIAGIASHLLPDFEMPIGWKLSV